MSFVGLLLYVVILFLRFRFQQKQWIIVASPNGKGQTSLQSSDAKQHISSTWMIQSILSLNSR